jgi:flagellar hook protein FlgE
MMRSLYSGVAGLKTHQTKMDVLGNNIANVNTTSFKSQSITFSDLMYQTTQTASGATATKGGVNARQIGLGAKSGAIATAIESQGATQTTNNPFDIMITGKSFFVVSDGTQRLYTRDGSFYVDGAGNLAMQSNGYLVQGWAAQEDRETGEIKINTNGELTGLQIMSASNSTYSPASTTAGLFSGNIDDNDTNVTSDDGKTVTMELYDNKGYLYTGKFTLKDTATDHLFALTLTDIIDSSGNSLGSDLLNEITFGDGAESINKVNGGYSFVVDDVTGTVDINADGGDVKYESVPLSGKLSDLMSTSGKKYKGLLNTAYLVTIPDEANYSSNATYEIDPDDGTLKITDTKGDVTDGAFAPASYKFQPATGYYYTNSDTLEAYSVPQSAEGYGSAFNEDYLNTVFQNTLKSGVTISDLISNDYGYTFDNATETITFKKALSLQKINNKTPYATSPLNDTTKMESQYFFNSDNKSLKSVVEEWLAADSSRSINQLNYTYTGAEGTVKIFANELTEGTSTTSSTIPNTGTFSEAQYDAFKTAAAAAGMDIDAITLANLQTLSTDSNTDVQTVAAVLKDVINNAVATLTPSTPGYTGDTSKITLRIESISGTNGAIITYPTTETGSETELGSFTQEVAATSTLKAPYERKLPTYVYSNITGSNNYNKGFALSSLSGSFTGGGTNPYEQILSTAFGTDANVMNFLNNIKSGVDYTVTFSSADGSVDITHVETSAKNKDSAYDVSNNGDGTINYTSMEAYGDVPQKGNIADLLEAAKGENAGLLKKVYGISDEAADAYGTDGTYEIITEAGENFGKIRLMTGEHSIQLEFNAANGALIAADGNKSGMVTLNFNQDKPGLEAFGFQASAANPDEAEKAGNLYIDFASVTNYNTNGASTIKAVKGDKKSLNTGRAVGEMNGVSISTDGQIYATYSNGQTKLLGQIASAEFANASGLSKQGDNLYTSTLNSGEATIQDITTDGGYMNTGVLEMSNVDLSREFTEMITTQRGFQANSRIITVSDTLLEELTNLKR